MTDMDCPRRRVLLRNGSIYCSDWPSATAMLTVGERVAWVGSEEKAAVHAESVDSVVDLEGSLVTPGFVDAHVHLALTGLALVSLDLSDAASLAEALQNLQTYADAAPGGPVIFAHGWDETRWPEGRAPTAGELDAAVGNRVAYLSRVDSHSAVVSTALIAEDPSIPATDGWRGDGLVERDAHHAARAVTSRLGSSEDRSTALLRALRHAASRGITSVHELNAPHISPFDDFAALRELCRSQPLPEVVPYWGEHCGGEADDPALVGYAGDLCADGAIGSRTASLHEPYADADTAGFLYLDSSEVSEHVVYCTQRGLQAGFHVIGERAVDEVTEGLRRAAAVVGTEAMISARHRLEHVEMPTRQAISTLAELGVVASVQPAFDAAWGGVGGLYARRLGARRAAAMNPFASMHAAGVMLAFGSDSPVTPLDPWAGVQSAVFHSNAAERLPVAAAFDAATRGGHRARRRDDAGVLTAGAEATYAVWDLSADAAGRDGDGDGAGAGLPRLPDLTPGRVLPRCAQTVVAGTTIFSAEDD